MKFVAGFQDVLADDESFFVNGKISDHDSLVDLFF